MWTITSVAVIEFDRIEIWSFDTAVYAIGWLFGWVLLWTPRALQPATARGPRRAISVVIPARNESTTLPHLLRPLVEQRRPGDQIVVVNDHSTDSTAKVAALFDVEVIEPPVPAEGWLGKPNACWYGASCTDAPILVFLDADVRPAPTLLDDLSAEVERNSDDLVSVQPWHRMETVGEQPSILFNLTALMGSGAFTIFGRRATANVAFGPVIALDRTTYLAAGGHGAPGVRSIITEDIGLARAVGRSHVRIGTPASTTFRMYPTGLGALVEGWTRSIAAGARFVPWWLALATACWVWSLAGGWLAMPVVYPLSALQIYVLGRRVGSIHPVTAVLFPLLVITFVIVFARSLGAIVFRRSVTWKGRRIDATTHR